MIESDIKMGGTQVKVKIKPGPASPAQKHIWRRFWQKLIAEVKASER